MTATRPNSKHRASPKRRIRPNSDVIDDAAATGMQIYGDIWAIPGAALEQSIKTGLQLKDAVKGHLSRAIRRNSVTWEDDDNDIRRDLLFAASRSRNAEELARIHKWAAAKRDTALTAAVEARAADLRIPLSDLKRGYPRGWNPRFAYRAVRNESVEQGFWRDGIFHPIRSSDDYDPEAVGERHQYAPVKRRRNESVEQGFWRDGIFHPIRSSDDYDPEAVGEKHQYAQRKKGRKRNPENLAAHFFKKFHGRDSEEEIVVETSVHFHEWLGTLGILAACVVDTPSGFRATITFEEKDAPWLCSNEDGTQLFIEAGNQELDLKALGFSGHELTKERIVVGEFSDPEAGRKWNIGYLCQKDFDDFEDILYQHDLSEPDEGEPKGHRRIPAYLEYEPLNKLLYITGGDYHIKLPAFRTSPGIEN